MNFLKFKFIIITKPITKQKSVFKVKNKDYEFYKIKIYNDNKTDNKF